MVSPTDMDFLLEVALCPRTGQKLHKEGDRLITEDGKLAYGIQDGIPVLMAEQAAEVSP